MERDSRRRRWAMSLLLTAGAAALALAGGCAKRAWYARHGSPEGDGPGVRVAARADTVLARQPAVARPAAVAPVPVADPVASGGFALDEGVGRVSAELPWEEAAPGPAGAGVEPCARPPCHWVQVAAPADSFGCAGVMSRARAMVGARGLAAAGPGGRVLHEGGLWKVQIGPYADWAEAEAARALLREGGFAGAWLIRR